MDAYTSPLGYYSHIGWDTYRHYCRCIENVIETINHFFLKNEYSELPGFRVILQAFVPKKVSVSFAKRCTK